MVIKREGKKNLLSHTLQYPTKQLQLENPFVTERGRTDAQYWMMGLIVERTLAYLKMK